MNTNPQHVLIATVGGSPEPIVASLLHWKPIRVYFIVSPDTSHLVSDIVDEPSLKNQEGWSLDVGRCENFTIFNPQNYSEIFNQLRELEKQVQTYLDTHKQDGQTLRVVCDFTGGTKPMSAALGLMMAQWACVVSYVGGTERTKDGVGIVEEGKEQIIEDENPWYKLKVSELDRALQLLRHNAFGASARLLERARNDTLDQPRKDELNAVAQLANALNHWDRFDHGKAAKTLQQFGKYVNDLKAVLDRAQAEHIRDEAKKLREHCESILSVENGVSRALILDLIGNAQRRMEEERWDDATARLYRAIEAIAQLKLRERGIDTGGVSLDLVPEDLKPELASKKRDEKLQIGLQDAWRLLTSLGDPSAKIFEKQRSRVEPLLMERNRSILAHGFTPVAKTTSEQLFQAALELLGADESELPKFRWPNTD